MYLDVNNLYGYVTSQFLLTSGFKLIDAKEFDFNKCTSKNSKVHFLEVDLKYPKESRDLDN